MWKPKPKASEARLLFELSEIQYLSVKTPKSDSYELKRQPEGWQIVYPGIYAVDSDSVGELLSAIQSIKASRSFEKPETASYTDYGFQGSAWQVSVESKALTVAFEIGGHIPDGQATYLRVMGDPTIYVVSTFWADQIKKKLFDVRDKNVFVFPTSLVSAWTLTGPGGTIEVKRYPEDRWTRSDHQILEGRFVQQLLDLFSEITASRFLGDMAFSPRFEYELQLRMLDGSQHDFRMSHYDRDEFFGKKLGSQSVIAFSAPDLFNLMSSPDRWPLEQHPFKIDRFSLLSLQIRGQTSVDLEVDKKGRWSSNLNRKEQTLRMHNFLTHLGGVNSSDSSLASMVSVSEEDLRLRVGFRFKNNAVATLNIWEKESAIWAGYSDSLRVYRLTLNQSQIEDWVRPFFEE